MNRFFAALFPAAAALCFLWLTGCVQNPPVEEGKAQSVTATEAQAGSNLSLAVSQRLEIRLPSTPSTGFHWTQTAPMHGALRDASPVYERPPALQDGSGQVISQPGATGTEIFTFAAMRPGEQSLIFEYRRAWENAEPAQRLTYTVTVH